MSHVHGPCRRAARRETESEGADGEGEGESEGEAYGFLEIGCCNYRPEITVEIT